MAVSTSSASQPIITTNNDKKNKKKRKIGSDDAQQQQIPTLPSSSPAKRTKSPGVRVVRGRIYDSENGKTCHQCRQKTMDFVAPCKIQRKNKPCTIKFCHKCLLNRYGEKAEEMAVLDDWKCPKCRGICNCSFCMIKRGHRPTGILVHTAKATGFSSVSAMLNVKDPEKSVPGNIIEIVDTSSKKLPASNKESTVTSTRKLGKENSYDGKSDSNMQHKSLTVNGDVKNHEKNNHKKVRENCTDEKARKGNGDDCVSKRKSPKKYQISKNISKKEDSTDKGGDDGTLEKMSSPKKVSKVMSLNPMKKEENVGEKARKGNEDACVSKKKSPKKYQTSKNISKNDPTDKGGDDGTLENMSSPKKVLKEMSLNPMKKEENVGEKYVSLPACIKDEVPDNVNINKTGAKPKPVRESRRLKKSIVMVENKDSDADIPLPKGTDLTTVAGVDLPAEDVGNALQFLEFCTAFGRVLDLKKGQPESILLELIRGRNRCRGRAQYSSIARFHIQLLSLIQKDSGEESPLNPTNGHSWLKALGRCISESRFASKKLPLDCFDRRGDGYDKLDSSRKLKLLNFLCDEALGTVNLRNWIHEQNSNFVEREKEAKEKLLAAKDKERSMKRKLQDELAKAIILKIGAPLSISEHEGLVSRIKIEAAQAHAETLEAMDMVPKKKQRSDAVRTEPILFDGAGCVYWRLRGYSDKPNILVQDIRRWDSITPEERWFTYDVEQTKAFERHISSSRMRKRLGSQLISEAVRSGSNGAGAKQDALGDSPPPKSLIEGS